MRCALLWAGDFIEEVATAHWGTRLGMGPGAAADRAVKLLDDRLKKLDALHVFLSETSV
jgi:hypothetical protein